MLYRNEHVFQDDFIRKAGKIFRDGGSIELINCNNFNDHKKDLLAKKIFLVANYWYMNYVSNYLNIVATR